MYAAASEIGALYAYNTASVSREPDRLGSMGRKLGRIN